MRRHLRRGRDEGRRGALGIRSSQADHALFGGVVPEIASRRHLELVVPVIEAALAQAGATLDDATPIAVTQGPGLIGALLVGLSTAKALAYGRRLPLVPVDHLLGHIAALRLAPLGLEPPFACLLASGGHTLVLDVADYAAPRRLGGTRDDAAGEAFDKGARLLGLSAAGGAALELVARDGDPERFPFPAVLRGQDGHDLSFSGLKTALLRRVRDLGDELPGVRADLAAGYQAAIVRQLVERAVGALDATGRSDARRRRRRRRQRRAPCGSGRRLRRPWRPAQPAATRPVRRQRGDDRRRGARRSGARALGLPRARRLRAQPAGGLVEPHGSCTLSGS